MQRRTLLAVTGGTLCGLAGCIGTGSERTLESAGTGDETDGSDDDSDEDVVVESDETDEPDERIEIGNRDELDFPDAHPPHTFELRNGGETDRDVTLVVETDDADEPVLEREVDLEAEAAIELVFVEPRSYAITVATTDDGGESTVTDRIDRRPFDCTRSETTVEIGDGFSMESSSTSTGCPTPRIADESLERGDGECTDRTDGDEAVVQFADESVTVDGAVTTPTPCHELTLAETTYDERGDVLAVTVAVGEGADDCESCLGVVEYDAQISLEGRYPGRADVYHERDDETDRVASVAYDGEL